MAKYKYLSLLAVLALFFSVSPQKTQAQIAVQVGPPPVCPYGYFAYPPYDCAPYGYYGPEWFPNGIFIGAGPWFHGGDPFWGRVDRHYDRRFGYHGEYPHRGEHFDEHHRPDHMQNFRGNEERDGRGHARPEHEHGDRRPH